MNRFDIGRCHGLLKYRITCLRAIRGRLRLLFLIFIWFQPSQIGRMLCLSSSSPPGVTQFPLNPTDDAAQSEAVRAFNSHYSP